MTSKACTKYVNTKGSTAQNQELATKSIAIIMTNETAK